MTNDPMITLSLIMWNGAFARFARVRKEEGGASVLEWALIAAVVVVAASIIGAIIINIVKQKGQKLQDCSDSTVSCG